MKFSYALIKKLVPGVPSSQKLGMALSDHSFELDSASGDVLDFKIPSNQYSAMASHIGVAREAAVQFGLPFKNPVKSVKAPSGKGLLAINVEDKKFCFRYVGRVFELTKPVGPSPAWMQNVLRSCGVNAINLIVDLGNYVMLETGQPVHVFDADKLAGEKKKTIIVRKARKGETMETLDGKKIALDPSVGVIADASGPLAIAGIKGGKSSGVTKETKRIILEAANFDAPQIYQAMQKINLRTDGGIRHAHGLSPALSMWGVDRFAELLLQEGAKLIDSAEYSAKLPGDAVIDFDPALYEKRIGAAVTLLDATRIFRGLGFDVKPMTVKNKKILRVRIPAWRTDVTIQEDLDEEIARFSGYNELLPAPPMVHYLHAEDDQIVSLKDRARDVLVRLGLCEIYTGSFITPEEVGAGELFTPFIFGEKMSAVRVTNPVAEDRPFLRPSLVPGIKNAVIGNARFMDSVQCFEIGTVMGRRDGVISECSSLGIAWAGKQQAKAALHLKGIVKELLSGLGIAEFDMIENAGGLTVKTGEQVLGRIVLDVPGRHWHAAYAEIAMDEVLEIAEERRAFKAIPKYPSVVRDVSVLVARDMRMGDLTDAMHAVNPKLIDEVDLIDEYQDEKLGKKQSLTFRIVFQSEERTLTDEEVNGEMKKIEDVLISRFAAAVR